jgi:hypothetical protein
VFTLHLQGNNQYVFYPGNYTFPGANSDVNFSCAPGDEGGTGPGTWSPVLSSQILSLPDTGFSLRGKYTTTMNAPEQPVSAAFGGSPAVIEATVSWDFEPGSLPARVGIVPGTPSRESATNNIVITVSVTNTGGSVSENTRITVARISTASATNLPVTLGDIDPQATKTAVLIFPGAAGLPGHPAALTVGGSYTGGSFTGASRITLP